MKRVSMSYNNFTFHIINDIPWSNLNRDDSGVPKRTILGGVERGLLSSQSIKRAIRKDFETRILEKGVPEGNTSLRTRNVYDYVKNRLEVILSTSNDHSNFVLNEKKLERFVTSLLKKLTGSTETVVLLSVEELETIVETILKNIEKLGEISDNIDSASEIIKHGKKSGALAIAAFGRMFANSFDLTTEAAIAVSPAISTHNSMIETDYFITADDYIVNNSGAGAAHLGTALYTSGIFYRTVTISLPDLTNNWLGFSGEYAKEQIEQLIESIVYSLPTGKKNSTSPYVFPALVIVEKQNYREAYSIEKPISLNAETGYLEPTIESIKKQFFNVRELSPKNYGDSLISGTNAHVFDDYISLDNLISQSAEWVLDYYKEHTHTPKDTVEEELTQDSDTEEETSDDALFYSEEENIHNFQEENLQEN